MPAESVLGPLLEGGPGAVMSFILGALFGSFANVCIYRLPPTDEHPKGRSVVTPGSHCFACGAAVAWYDNVPLLSYLWLRGRCRGCAAAFSPRYLIVEGVTALLFLAAYLHSEASAATLGAQLHGFAILAAFSFTLVVITFIDLDHKLILDKVTYPAVVVFYLVGLSVPGADWKTGVIGAVVGYGLIRLVSDGYYYATGREGLGYGDGKLLAVVGALYGWRAVLVSLFLGSLLGSVISIAVLGVQRARDRRRQPEKLQEVQQRPPAAEELALRHVEVPFGPFLAAGALLFAFGQGWLQERFAAVFGPLW